MPGFDGTGPMGEGPGTGGGFGLCGAARKQSIGCVGYARRGRCSGRRFGTSGGNSAEVIKLRRQIAELTDKLRSTQKDTDI